MSGQFLHNLLLFGRVLGGDDLDDTVVLELDDSGFLVEVGVGTRENLDGIGAQMIPAHPVGPGFAVSAAPQLGDNFGRADAVAQRDGLRRREDHGCAGKRALTELPVDEAGVLDVKIRECDKTDGKERNCETQNDFAGRVKEDAGKPDLFSYFFSYFDFRH